MKSYALIALATLVAAQTPDISSLPACGKVCITNMLAKAQGLGCTGETDVSCLCKNQDFVYGVRDCTNESCPASDKATVIAFGNSICSNAAGSGTGGTVTQTVSSGAATVVVSTGTGPNGPFTTTIAGGGAGGVGGAGGASGAGGAGMATTLTNSDGKPTLTTTIKPETAGVATTLTNSAGSGTLTTTVNPSAMGMPTSSGLKSAESSIASAASASGSMAASAASGSGSGSGSSASSAGFAAQATAPLAFGGLAGLAALALL